MNIGERIVLIRKLRGMTQEELSEKMGVPRTTLNNWELGVRRLHADNLPALCSALNCSSDTLLGIDNSSNVLKEYENELQNLMKCERAVRQISKSAEEILMIFRGGIRNGEQ